MILHVDFIQETKELKYLKLKFQVP